MNRMLPITMVLALLLWWLWPREQRQTGGALGTGFSQPNVVSRNALQTQAKSKPVNTSTQHPNQAKQAQTTVVGATSADPGEDTTLTYLDVYRKTRLFNRCQQTIYRLLREPNHDPLNELQNKLKRLVAANEVPPQATTAQIEAVIQHHAQCSHLLATIEQLESTYPVGESPHVDELFKQKKAALHSWLSQTQARTAKEQAIAETLRLRDAWNQQFDALLQVSMGDDSQHPEKIAALQQQASEIQAQVDDILEQMRATDDKAPLQEQLSDWSGQYHQVQEEINQLNWVDPAKRALHMAAFNQLNDQLFAKLSSQDPDVFFETQMTLEKTNRIQYFGHSPYKDIGNYRAKMPLIEYVSPGDVVMQAIELHDPEVFRLVIQHATQLYHCKLGADCGPNSPWIEYYCFASYDQIDATSCKMDLPAYLHQHRLNDNQWQDVNWVLDMLRSLYAT